MLSCLTRAGSFYREHGLQSSVNRLGEAVRRLSTYGRTALYSCSLPTDGPVLPAGFSVERCNAVSLPVADHEQIVARNRSLVELQLAERFAAGSEIWLARQNGELAGFGWTIQGRTLEPHFFPLDAEEVHLYDFFVFPQFRGRGINVSLVAGMLRQLAAGTVRRAHIECGCWNTAQIRSLDKTAFKAHAIASKFTLGSRTVVVWY